MDNNDPITLFFPGESSVDLYAVLNLKEDASPDYIKKAYRRLALVYHPDKHATAAEQAKADASTKFQQIGFAYAVLSDEKRKTRYDRTGETNEGFELGSGDDGWETYFQDLFDGVTRGKLDQMKKEYQGSTEEVEDLKSAYLETNGSIADIMTYIPHSTYEDEDRLTITISSLIFQGELKTTPAWETGVKDQRAKLARMKKAEREAKEAEKLAKELGVWDEFYGSGKATDRKKAKEKGKGKGQGEDAEHNDESALQALILKKNKKNMDGFFDSLAAKYSEPKATSREKGKKRAHSAADDGEPPNKKSRRGVPPPPEIDDAEFAELQAKLFGGKRKVDIPEANGRIKRKGRKAK